MPKSWKMDVDALAGAWLQWSDCQLPLLRFWVMYRDSHFCSSLKQPHSYKLCCHISCPCPCRTWATDGQSAGQAGHAFGALAAVADWRAATGDPTGRRRQRHRVSVSVVSLCICGGLVSACGHRGCIAALLLKKGQPFRFSHQCLSWECS